MLTLNMNRYCIEWLIRLVIQVFYVINIEYSYSTDKYEDYYKLINIEARNIFSKGLFSAVLKYTCGYNIYSMRDSMINELKVDVLCYRHSKVKLGAYNLVWAY